MTDTTLPTIELYRYRAHRTLQELHNYKNLLISVRCDGIKEPVRLATDGVHAVLEDGHKRVHAAIELGIKRLPVTIVQRQFGRNRRVKYPLGPELAELLHPAPPPKEEEPAASSSGGEGGAQAQQEQPSIT